MMLARERPLVESLLQLETPRLLLDLDRLEHNCASMRERCRSLGVTLRPHLKTPKSLEVARVAAGGEPGPITVSTLKEAEYFARGGMKDILYAATVVPGKLPHALRIMRETGCRLTFVTDSAGVISAAHSFAAANDAVLPFLIEIDCGEHRSGVAADDLNRIVSLARAIDASSHLRLGGVMTHAGHSYGTKDLARVEEIAAAERAAAVGAAGAIRAAGLRCEIVSVGSTPTVLHAPHLDGVTEARAGIYMVWDLAQLSRNICRIEDIAVSVLTSVIGHNRQGGSLILDAGALALSKDISANTFLPDAAYGYVCDAETAARLGSLSVTVVHQEHGTVRVDDTAWFDRLPVGSLVRVLPNHACITCAAYEGYELVRGSKLAGYWERVNGW